MEADLQWSIEAGIALGIHGRVLQESDPVVSVYRCLECGTWMIEVPLGR